MLDPLEGFLACPSPGDRLVLPGGMVAWEWKEWAGDGTMRAYREECRRDASGACSTPRTLEVISSGAWRDLARWACSLSRVSAPAPRPLDRSAVVLEALTSLRDDAVAEHDFERAAGFRCILDRAKDLLIGCLHSNIGRCAECLRVEREQKDLARAEKVFLPKVER